MPRRVQKYRDEGNIWEEEEYRSRRGQADEERPKAPLMLRVLAWGGVVLLCFVGGYIGTSWGINFLNRQDLLVQKDVVTTPEEAEKLLENGRLVDTGAQNQENLDIKKITLNLSYPKDGAIISEKFELISGIREQEIKDTIEKLFSVSKMFSKEVLIKHIFRNASTLYVDVAGPFIPMLSNAGQAQSSLFITGVVRTMIDNFPPVSEIRFLVNGAVTTAGSPVDLTAAWRLP